MKRIIILLFLAFVCTDLKAQIYHSEVCFYIKAGESLTDNTSIKMVSFAGETIKIGAKAKREITAKLRESADYWDDWMSNQNYIPSHYNSDLSTYSKEVYTRRWSGPDIYYWNSPWDNEVYSNTIGTYFYAFATDLSSYIYWRQRENSETIEEKTHYKRIDKSELMPNEHLYDFLDD